MNIHTLSFGRAVIIVSLVLVFFAGRPAFSADTLTCSDVNEVINTIHREYYRPVDGRVLTGACLSTIKTMLSEMGIPPVEPDRSSSAEEDLKLMEMSLQKVPLSPAAINEILYRGLRKMFETLGDEGTKIEMPTAHFKTLKELGYDRGGAGLFVSEKKDDQGYFTVIETLPGFLPEQLGIRTGDRILMVDGLDLKGLSYSQLADIIRGPIGSDVTLTWQNQDRGTIKTSTIQRRWLAPNFKSLSVEILDGGIICVRIKFLGENLEPELSRILKKNGDGEGTKIILDLRNNGGTIKGAREFAGSMCARGEILYGVVKHQNREEFHSYGQKLPTLPTVVLINEHSGSPSVLFAGILQDHGRARIVGAEAAWDEYVNSYHALPNGSIYTVTDGYYELPRGRQLLSKHAVRPDYVVAQDPLKSYRKGDDRQLEKALQILRKQ